MVSNLSWAGIEIDPELGFGKIQAALRGRARGSDDGLPFDARDLGDPAFGRQSFLGVLRAPLSGN